MADKTEIAWTDSTFNPWVNCQETSPACDNCYARSWFSRFHGAENWGPRKPRIRTAPANWKQPLRWNAKPFYECPTCGWRGDNPDERPRCPQCAETFMLKPARRRVFCASLGDVFDNEVPVEWRRDLFALIDKTPNLDWLVLTKRIGNAKTMMADALSTCKAANRDGMIWPLPNVWLGATICNQPEADRDIPKLLATPARVRFLSVEPMLGPIDLDRVWIAYDRENWLDWVIAGGESGAKARPAHPDWFRGLRDQCAASGVPFFFKQWGEWAPRRPGPERDGLDGSTTLPAVDIWPCGYLAKDFAEFKARPTSTDGVLRQAMWRVGTKAAGRLLDGVLHDAFPEVSA